MDEVEKLKAVNSNREQRKEELVKELEQVDKPRTLDHTKDRQVIFCGIRVWAFQLDYQPKRFKIKLERLERFRVKFTANVNWYHMTKFCPELSLTVYYFYTKISSFTLALSKGIVLDSFYRLIFYSEKFSISIWRLSFVVNVTLNLCNKSSLTGRLAMTGRNALSLWLLNIWGEDAVLQG